MNQTRELARRPFLAGVGGGLTAGTAGCLGRLRASLGRSAPEQVSLSVTTVPADEDSKAIRIARRLTENFDAVGIDTTLEPQTEQQLLRDVLFEHDFDIFVVRHPGIDHPATLRTLLHSRFAEESGWQNPFGLSSPEVDDFLDEYVHQRPEQQRETVSEIQRAIVRRQPFSVVAYPDHVTAVGEWIVDDWNLLGFSSPETLLRIGDNLPAREALRIGTISPQITENRNPLSVEFRSRDPVLELLYDPLVRRSEDQYVPWLAEDVSYTGESITVQLRDGVTWHDGAPLTPEDVAFTYRFLVDTSPGEGESRVPAPRFRDRVSLVDSVTVTGPNEVTIDTIGASPAVYPWILTVPILPERHWKDRTGIVQDVLTEAIVVDNEEPIGTGPLRFVDAQGGQSLELERVGGHFMETQELAEELGPYAGRVPFDRLEYSVEPNALAAIELISEGEIDVIATPLESDAIAEADGTESVRLLVDRPNAFYMIGYNTRRHPLGNHTLRSILSRLLDRSHVVETVFEGRASPSDSPLARSGYVPADVLWQGESAVGAFPGSEGEVDPDPARDLFRDAGFRFDDSGDLITQQ